MKLNVQFKKGQETAGDIEITNGFLSFYKDKNGIPKVKIIILEYTAVAQEEVNEWTF